MARIAQCSQTTVIQRSETSAFAGNKTYPPLDRETGQRITALERLNDGPAA